MPSVIRKLMRSGSKRAKVMAVEVRLMKGDRPQLQRAVAPFQIRNDYEKMIRFEGSLEVCVGDKPKS